jgi:hypothetical protein
VSTIRETVVNALDPSVVRSYGTYIDRVVEALEERDGQIADALMTFAESKGLRPGDAKDLMIEVGLIEPEPVVEVHTAEGTEGSTDLQAVLAAIEGLRGEVAAIKSAAARHGVRV